MTHCLVFIVISVNGDQTDKHTIELISIDSCIIVPSCKANMAGLMDYTVSSSWSSRNEDTTNTTVQLFDYNHDATPIWMCSTHVTVAALNEANQDDVSLRRREGTLVGFWWAFIFICCEVLCGECWWYWAYLPNKGSYAIGAFQL